jgi:hypothetical protein
VKTLKVVKPDYHQYLASREWALLKNAVRERSGGICERCKQGPYQQTHHLTYERLGCERLEDLQALCWYCHEYLSAVSAFDPLQPDAVDLEPDNFDRRQFDQTILAPITRIQNPDFRKKAATHLANTLGIPPSILISRVELARQRADEL